MTIERRSGFAGRVTLEVHFLPHGVRVLNIRLNGVLITEKETPRDIMLYVEPWVKPREVPIAVVARLESKKDAVSAAKSVTLKITQP